MELVFLVDYFVHIIAFMKGKFSATTLFQSFSTEFLLKIQKQQSQNFVQQLLIRFSGLS